MRYFYLLLLTALLAEPLRAQSPKLAVDIVPLDLPYQSLSAQMYSQHNCGNPNCGLRSAVWAFGSPSMRQATAVGKSFHEAINYGGYKLWHRRPTDNPLRKIANGTGEALTSLLANTLAIYLPLGSGWVHEEFHRNALTRRQVYSYDDLYSLNLLAETISVNRVADEDLVNFKQNHPAEYVRAAAAGIEGEYQVITSTQKDAFFYDIKTGSATPTFYWLTTIGTTGYVRFCTQPAADATTDDLNTREPTAAIRDWVGLDFTAWTYDLFQPNEPYASRGVHPSGVGIDRYVRYGDLTPAMQSYLRVMGNRQLINYVSPHLLGIRRIRLGKETWGNFALRHYLTSFGDDLNIDLFFKHRDNNFYAVIHRYSNYNRGFPGVEIQWVDKPVRVAWQPLTASLRGMAWTQPDKQSFFTQKSRAGGLLSAQVRWSPGRVWQPYVEAEAKTAGWVAGNPFLDATISVRAGVMAFVF